MAAVTVPYNFAPRDYQLPIFTNVLGDGDAPPTRNKHLVMMSRRSGKTLSLLHVMAVQMFLERNAYLILLPEATQARRVVWNGKTQDGQDLLDAVFPASLVTAKNTTNMTVTTINGSMLTIGGADNINSLMGGQYKGVILDEAALMRHNVYGYLKPILEANGGWLVLSSTPRYGSWFNDLFDIESMRPDNSLWDTHRVDIYRTGMFTQAQIEAIRQDYIDRYGPDDGAALFSTEYEVLTNVQQQGSYYGGILRDSAPLVPLSYNPALPVYASYDLGTSDACVITFFQVYWSSAAKPVIHVLDAAHGRGKTVDDYYKEHIVPQPWYVHTHILPHDGGHVRGYTSSESAADVLRRLRQGVVVLPNTASVLDDINAVRVHLPGFVFNGNSPGATKLRQHMVKYSKDYDARNKQWLGRPKHDESSHWADSVRYLVAGLPYIKPAEQPNFTINTSADSWLT